MILVGELPCSYDWRGCARKRRERAKASWLLIVLHKTRREAVPEEAGHAVYLYFIKYLEKVHVPQYFYKKKI